MTQQEVPFWRARAGLASLKRGETESRCGRARPGSGEYAGEPASALNGKVPIARSRCFGRCRLSGSENRRTALTAALFVVTILTDILSVFE